MEEQDERPLSAVGQRQAIRLAEALLRTPVDALFSSPPSRCRQTLQPVGDRLVLPIETMPELRETDEFAPPPCWDAPLWSDIPASLGGACAAGRTFGPFRRVTTRFPTRRVVACSHGDIIPALVAFLTGAYALSPVPPLTRRGGWYVIERTDDTGRITAPQAHADFPD